MKFAVRVLVLGMLVTGFAADHMMANKTASATPANTMVSSLSASPVPMCQPGRGGCGF